MPKYSSKSEKTDRILSMYYLFMRCKEVSKKELRDDLGTTGWSDKTYFRDIAFLKQTGMPIRFSGRRNAYVLVDENGSEEGLPKWREPVYPEGKKEKQYMQRLMRLMDIISGLPCEDCGTWYKETFPDMSKRTMQRDFATLKDLGFEIYYKRAWDDPYDKDYGTPAGCYYYDGRWGEYA